MKIQNCSNPLQILIIGGNGGIGRKCIEIALVEGHFVTAILRTPSKLDISHPRLQIFKGDINEPQSICFHMEKKDAVISTIGVSGGIFGDKPTTLYSTGAKNLLKEANTTGVKRAFFISASALEVSPVNSFFIRFMTKNVIQKLLKHMYQDLLKMEDIVKNTDINWTIVRPPQLTDTARTGIYRYAINKFLKDCTKISRADVADFIIGNICNEETYQGIIEISY